MIAKWEQRDPLKVLGKALLDQYGASDRPSYPSPEQNCTDSVSPRVDNASSVRDDLRAEDLNSSVLA